MDAIQLPQKLGFSKKTAGMIAAAIIQQIFAYTVPRK
jgi:hypothetical protein